MYLVRFVVGQDASVSSVSTISSLHQPKPANTASHHNDKCSSLPASTSTKEQHIGETKTRYPGFPSSHLLQKICNKNTLKLSCSCMPNIATIISSHNKRLLAIKEKCNYRKKETWPLLGKCQTKGVVYQATVKRKENKDEQTYVGITEGAFKTR